jgi:DNA-binding MarR family transcriptional regulator
MSAPHLGPGLGTRLRNMLELLDGDVAKVYTDLGLDGFRPRFTPVVGALVRLGPLPIRDLARALAVTHSAASQTIAQMGKDGLVTLEPGADARQRIVHLTPKAEALLPALEAEWNATEAAAREFDAELPFSLTELVDVATRALEERPFRQRIAATAEAKRLTELFPEEPGA